MPSPSLAFEALAYAERTPAQTPLRASGPPVAISPDAGYYDLLAEIRAHEGEIVENPPLLFKLTVAVGCAMTAAGVVGLGLGAARLIQWWL